MTLSRRFLSTARAFLSKFRERSDGTVAVEFALIAPVLILLYIGLFQISMLITEDRNVSHAASVIGDLATLSDEITDEEIEDIFQAGAEILGITNPDAWNEVSMQLVSLSFGNGPGDYQVEGIAQIGGGFDDASKQTYDPLILSNESGAMVARIRYNYYLNSYGSGAYNGEDNFFGGQTMLEEEYLLKPRAATFVGFKDSGKNLLTCTINSGTVSC